MNKAYLLTGSNQKNPLRQLHDAKKRIEEKCGKIIKSSSVYQTQAWGIQDQPDFFNQAILIETSFPAPTLMRALLKIELEMGRVRIQKFGPRIIDIDIIFFNHDTIVSRDLVIPHPSLQERRFALLPLNEIASHYSHPVLNKTVSELLKSCKDKLEVLKLDI